MRSKKFLKNHRGQALVLYALLTPLLFLFVGMGIDLGWYFINVSRLQNAADAAALAGAQALVKQDDFNNYLVISMASNKLPADFDDYKDAYTNTFDSSTIASGKLYNYKHIEDIADALKEGRKSAEEYTRKNLADSTAVDESSNNTDTFSATDGWSNSRSDSGKTVSGKIELKYKIVDGKNDVYGPLYYVVNLTEKIRHLFMPGWFDPMEAPVKAVVLLKPHYKGLIEPMEQLERTQVIDNWEYAKKYRGTTGEYAGKWNHYQAGIRNNNNYGVRYTSGNAYRNESVIVTTSRKTSGKNIITSADGSSGEATDANGNKWYSANEVDSINIDFRAEVTGKFTSDWDLGYDFPETGHGYKFSEGWSATYGSNKRILFNAEFDEAFTTRDESKQADPLWVRIESDPLKNPYTGAGVSNFNSVRQVTLNFNDDNTIVEGDHYKYRPYVIFYDGPENIDYAVDPKTGVLIRHSQPVVLNLNEDTNAIIYMPNSPVIINGNGNTLHGFVIAKCYLKAVTEAEIIGNNSITLYDGFNAASTLQCGYIKGLDGTDQTVYYDKDDLLDLSDIYKTYPDNNLTNTTSNDTTDNTPTYKSEIVVDETTGNIVVKEMAQAPKYPILSFTKDLYTNCTTLEEYFAATANYINSTYTKANYAKFSGLKESEISMITFPEENEKIVNNTGNLNNTKYGNFTAITIPVATADLLDSDPDPDTAQGYLTKDNKYVKVMLGTEVKYIAKSKLPHMRINRNSNCPYVCIYDLKTGITYDGDGNYATVKPMDDSTSTADSEAVFTNSIDEKVPGSNKWGNVWIIEKQLLEKIYDSKYKAGSLTFTTDSNGFKYFSLNSDINSLPKDPQIIAKYHKIKLLDADGKVLKDDKGNEIVKYVKDDDDDDIQYYTKVDNNTDDKGNVINYIIVDKKGNILTKPVTAPELRLPENVDSKAENEALKTNIGGTALYDYWNTYTRVPNENRPREIPGDVGTTNDEGQYVGKSEYRKNEDYRIPAWERVYSITDSNEHKNVFNLSADSYYSFFDIEELRRVNYTYLNIDEFNHTVNREPSDETSTYYWKVDDMFFTTVRAGWID